MNKDFFRFITNRILKNWDFTKGWPCRCCNGKGWYYDDEKDPPCPIEGHKLCTRFPCKTCNKTGIDDYSLDYWIKEFDKHKEETIKKEKEKENNKKIVQQALSKLTQLEKEKLSHYYRYGDS